MTISSITRCETEKKQKRFSQQILKWKQKETITTSNLSPMETQTGGPDFPDNSEKFIFLL